MTDRPDAAPLTVAARPRAEAVIDLDALSGNVSRLIEHVGGRDLMAVVKADAYGHGMVAAGRAARRGGAGWLGVALLEEALALRAAGDDGPILSWLAIPGERYDLGIAAGVDLSAYTAAQVDDIADHAARLGRRARVQAKLDSGLSRGGATPDQWPALLDAVKRRQASGDVELTGVWSHLACSDTPEHPSIAAQLAAYEAAVSHALAEGLEPAHLHLANSGAVLELPSTWFTMVRPGIAVYGVSPFADGRSPVPLAPVMRLEASLALVKRVGAGQGVSYGHTYVTERETTLGLVPLGYGDGVPLHASNRGPVSIGGRRHTVAGRVCMDQFVVDLGDATPAPGDPVVLIGDGRAGEPTAHAWAEAAGTIAYEIVTRVGARVPRRYVGAVA